MRFVLPSMNIELWIFMCTYFASDFALLTVVLRHTANNGVVVAGNAINSCIFLHIRINYKKPFDNAVAVICPFLLPTICHLVRRSAYAVNASAVNSNTGAELIMADKNVRARARVWVGVCVWMCQKVVIFLIVFWC